jgi:hypothetical protein
MIFLFAYPFNYHMAGVLILRTSCVKYFCVILNKWNNFEVADLRNPTKAYDSSWILKGSDDGI